MKIFLMLAMLSAPAALRGQAPPSPQSLYDAGSYEQAVSAIVVSYYWHFVDVVWIAIFTLVYLIR